MKERLDVLLVKRNLASSREKAKAIIMSGNVFVDGQREDKAGTSFSEEVQIEVRGHALPYVSRGGLKLEKAMKNFDVSMEGKVCTDVGSSTGGFTDCMLQNGAVKVFAIDVGHGQLDWKLRQDERVVCMEKTNIRYVQPEDLGEPIDFSSICIYSLQRCFGSFCFLCVFAIRNYIVILGFCQEKSARVLIMSFLAASFIFVGKPRGSSWLFVRFAAYFLILSVAMERLCPYNKCIRNIA